MNLNYLPKDQNLIHKVATWVFNEWGIHNPEATLEKIISSFDSRAESKSIPMTIVATDDAGNLLGTASLTITDMKSHPELAPWLSSVYVPSELRGQGIAKALCLRIEEEAKRLGHSKIYLFTDGAQGLYQKLGWQFRAQEIYRNLDVTIMDKDL